MDSYKEDIIQNCIVRIEPKIFSFGSGFFIDKGTILTCFHCVKNFNSTTIDLYFKGEKKLGEIVRAPFSEKFDLVIIKVKFSNHECVHLDNTLKTKDVVKIIGFSRENPELESITTEYAGLTSRKSGIQLLKFQTGKVVEGISGSPILNLSTGNICGIIKESDNPLLPMGGYGIPIDHFNICYPEYQVRNRIYNHTNLTWFENNVSVQSGIDDFDRTKEPHHFLTFKQHSIPVDDLFIEPNYELIEVNDLDIKKRTTTTFLQDSIRIIESQKFLYIIGSYGSGKTFLSKRIQKELRDRGLDTLFIRCSDVPYINDFDRLSEFIEKKHNSNKKLFCFFDGYDELNYLRKERFDIFLGFLTLILKLAKLKNIYIVVNTRKIPKTQEDFFKFIHLFANEILGIDSSLSINLIDFKNKNIESFLDSFSANVHNISKEEIKINPASRLFLEDLNKYHKNLKTVCSNPLFLYWVNYCFYTKVSPDLYSIINEFVNHTISGKFDFETKNIPALNEIKTKYREFLISMACTILTAQSRISFDAKYVYDFLLEDNLQVFELPNDKVLINITDIAPEILGPEILARIDTSRLKENILTCYFLEQHSHNKSWRFKDNNIMFFLIAQSFTDKFKLIVEKLNENCYSPETITECYNIICENEKVPIHPLTVEFIIYDLKRSSNEFISTIIFWFQELIKNGEFLQLNVKTLQRLNLNKLQINILLVIIYIQLNSEGYSSELLKYFFKRLNWYVSAVKNIDRNFLLLVRRFFKQSKIFNCEFRRINFDEYNFDQSELKNVTFIQNKFFGVRKNDIYFEEVEYKLCDFDDVEMNGIEGSVIFSGCSIARIRINNPKSICLRFKRCYIKDFEIHQTGPHPNPISLEFINCDIDDFIFRDHKPTKSNDLQLKRCFFNTLKLENSKVDVHTEDCVCKAHKLFKYFKVEDIRHTSNHDHFKDDENDEDNPQ